MNAPSNSPLAGKLLASAPAAEYGEAIKLYGFLPGRTLQLDIFARRAAG